MTTTRPQIIIEGSYDGENWEAYEFRWQTQALNQHPPIVAPYMPRLDWQLWFAGYGTIDRNPWFARFIGRLEEGSPEVLNLLGHSPFPPDEPPDFIRVQVYDYRFSTPGQKGNTGNWWQRDLIRDGY